MAKGRMITQEMSVDPGLNGISLEAHYCYMLAFTHLDRDGLIDGHPVKLWATICPLRYELLDRVPHIVNEWLQSGHVLRYNTNSQPVLFFKTFRRYNLRMKYNNEAASTFPPPPEWERTKSGLIPQNREECERLAEQFDERSTYRTALLSHLTDSLSRQESRVSRDKSRDKSRDLGRDQDQYKLSDHGGGGDQIIHTHPPVVSGKGGAGGANPDPLTLFDRPTLEQAAWQLGSLLGFHMQWNDYQQSITAYDHAALLDLLKWIKRYSDDPTLSLGAESLPAVVRHAISRKKPVYLTPNQTTALVTDILACVSLDTWQEHDHPLSIDL